MGFKYLPHLIVLLVAVLLIFGSAKLPDLAKNLGKSMRIIKDEAKALKADDAADEPKASTTDEPDAK